MILLLKCAEWLVGQLDTNTMRGVKRLGVPLMVTGVWGGSHPPLTLEDVWGGSHPH